MNRSQATGRGVSLTWTEGGRRRKTCSNTNLSGVPTAEGSRPVCIAQQRRVPDRCAWQREADHAIILHEEDGHAQGCLLDVAAPVGLVWGAPDLLRDDGDLGHGDEVEEPERDPVVRERGWLRVEYGRPREHQRVAPARHVGHELHFLRVHLEERFHEEGRISWTEHPHEIPVAAGERDTSICLILVHVSGGPREA
jgi:hypothetical protein